MEMTLTDLVNDLKELQKLFDAKEKAKNALVDKVSKLTGQKINEQTKNVLVHAGCKTPTYIKAKTAFQMRIEETQKELKEAGLEADKIKTLLTMKTGS